MDESWEKFRYDGEKEGKSLPTIVFVYCVLKAGHWVILNKKKTLIGLACAAAFCAGLAFADTRIRGFNPDYKYHGINQGQGKIDMKRNDTRLEYNKRCAYNPALCVKGYRGILE